MAKGTQHLNTRIEKHLRELIQKGEFKEGDRIPSERDIGKRFGASHIPVRQAVRRLVDKGILQRRHGMGTFVRKACIETALTNRIGVLYSWNDSAFLSSSFYSTILMGIESQAEEEDKTILLRSLGRSAGKDPSRTFHDLVGEVDGFIVVDPQPHVFSRVEKTLGNLEKPVVMVDYEGAPDEVDSVVSDSSGNTGKLIRFLIDLGHTRIACVYRCPQDGRQLHPNIAGLIRIYREKLIENGIEPDERLVLQLLPVGVASGPGSGKRSRPDPAPDLPAEDIEAFKAMMGSSAPPTALFCVSSYTAFQVYKIARCLGIDIPGDITVVGYDDVRECETVSPPLTTVRTPLVEMGAIAMKRLLERVGGTADHLPSAYKVVLPGEVISRESHRSIRPEGCQNSTGETSEHSH